MKTLKMNLSEKKWYPTGADLDVWHNNTEESVLHYRRKYYDHFTLLQRFFRISRSAHGTSP